MLTKTTPFARPLAVILALAAGPVAAWGQCLAYQEVAPAWITPTEFKEASSEKDLPAAARAVVADFDNEAQAVRTHGNGPSGRCMEWGSGS